MLLYVSKTRKGKEYVMLRYIAVKENGKNGISACEDDKVLSIIWDISPVYSDVEKLANTLNNLEVSLIHFNDIVEDYVQQIAM